MNRFEDYSKQERIEMRAFEEYIIQHEVEARLVLKQKLNKEPTIEEVEALLSEWFNEDWNGE